MKLYDASDVEEVVCCMVNGLRIGPLVDLQGQLQGFHVPMGWPRDLAQWADIAGAMTAIAALPGVLGTSLFFHAADPRDDDVPQVGGNPDVGVILCDGPTVGASAPAPGSLSSPPPRAVALLHPPRRDIQAATGCLFVPGVPHLGVSHQAVWSYATSDGTVVTLDAAPDVNPAAHPDTAVLAMLTCPVP